MPDELAAAPLPAPHPGRRPRRFVARTPVEAPPAPTTGKIIAGAVATLTLGAGVALVLIGATMSGTRGARASTRLQWEQRRAEMDQIAAQAEADGKLRKP